MALAIAVLGVASVANAAQMVYIHTVNGSSLGTPGGNLTPVVGDGNVWNQDGSSNTPVPLLNTDGTNTGVTFMAVPVGTTGGITAPQAWANTNGNTPSLGSLAGTPAANAGYVTSDFSALGGAQQYDTNAGGYSGTTCVETLITVAGLSPSTPYTVTFFADRVGGSGVRTGNYTATGTNTQMVTYDASTSGQLGIIGQFASPVVTDATGAFTLDCAEGTGNSGNAAGFFYMGAIEITAAVPEPASMALLGLGSLAMLKRRRA
jgi:hypothetical protein